MNYTEKYHLPQWEESDRVMRTDFNQMCADIDEGIAQAQEAAEELPFVTGSYSGGKVQSVTVGFRPSLVIVGAAKTAAVTNTNAALSIQPGFFSGDGIPNKLEITDTGFHLPYDHKETYPTLNVYGETYNYIAFR